MEDGATSVTTSQAVIAELRHSSFQMGWGVAGEHRSFCPLPFTAFKCHVT